MLASYVMSNVLSLVSPGRYFYTVKFSPAPTLSAGTLYHLVFKSIDANPSVNFLSVDAFYQIVWPTPCQPTMSDTDAAVLFSVKTEQHGNRAAGIHPFISSNFRMVSPRESATWRLGSELQNPFPARARSGKHLRFPERQRKFPPSRSAWPASVGTIP